MTPADPDRLASSIRRQDRLGDAPVDIFAYLGARADIVFIRRLGDNPNIDGIYVKGGDGGFIYVNRAKPLGRQRFTAAHEFGHHVLGHAEEVDADVFGESSTSTTERDANRFAAEFLAPRAAVIKFVSRARLDVSRLDDAVAVARHFGVTLQPALIQLRRTDRITSLDQTRLLEEAASVRPNPLVEWEQVVAAEKTAFADRFVQLVTAKYQAGKLTTEAAAEALDLPIEAFRERYPDRGQVDAVDDVDDLL